MKLKQPVPFRWKGNHHLYHGAWITAFCIFQWGMAIDNIDASIPIWQVGIGIGLYMMADDIVEHWVTASTPLRYLWDKMLKPHFKNKAP